MPLRNHTTGLRKLRQPIHCRYEPSHHNRRVVRRVLANERVDLPEIVAGLFSPENRPHRRNCFLISSCETSCPASDCRSPSSILIKKQSFSTASSSVASSGRLRSASMARSLAVWVRMSEFYTPNRTTTPHSLPCRPRKRRLAWSADGLRLTAARPLRLRSTASKTERISWGGIRSLLECVDSGSTIIACAARRFTAD